MKSVTIQLATNQIDEVPALTFTYLTYNNIEEACQKKKTLSLFKNSFAARCIHRPQEHRACGVTPKVLHLVLVERCSLYNSM